MQSCSALSNEIFRLEQGLVEERSDFYGELLQEYITIETRWVRGDVTVMAGDGHAGRIHEGEVPGIGHPMQVR